MTTQTKPASRRLTPIIAVTSGDNLSHGGSGRSPVTHVVYVTEQRADELYCAGVLTLIEVNGRQEYFLAAAPPALTGRAR